MEVRDLDPWMDRVLSKSYTSTITTRVSFEGKQKDNFPLLFR